MRKSFYYFLGIFAFLIVVALTAFLATGGMTGLTVSGHGIVSEGEIQYTQVSLSFKDNKTSCLLDGEVFVDGQKLGKTKKGVFALSEGNQGSELELKGFTSDCFGNNSGLGFVNYWKLPNLDSYFSYGSSLVLVTALDPRNPKTLEEVQSFIRSDEAKVYIDENEKYFKGDYESNLDRIADYNIFYRYDSIIYSDDYWQTPAETIKLNRGDCEDWTVAVLSMIKEYDSNAQCYGVLWQSHMSVLCYVNGKYIIYDQGDTKVVKTLNGDSEIEKKTELRKFLNEYFDSYGIESENQKVQGVVSTDSFKFFNNNDEFVSWLLDFDKI